MCQPGGESQCGEKGEGPRREVLRCHLANVGVLVLQPLLLAGESKAAAEAPRVVRDTAPPVEVPGALTTAYRILK